MNEQEQPSTNIVTCGKVHRLKWAVILSTLVGVDEVAGFLTSSTNHDRKFRLAPSRRSMLLCDQKLIRPSVRRKRPWDGSIRDPSLFYVSGTAEMNDELSQVEMSWEQVLLPKEMDDGCREQMDGDDEGRCSIEGYQPRSRQEIVEDKIFMGGSVLVMACLVVLMMMGSGDWRYYLAGGICAAVSHLIPVPVDVVKTRKQVDASLADVNFVQATRKIMKDEGWRALFVGTAPTFWGYFLEGAIKFGVYEFLKPWIKTIIPLKYLAFACSAAISGLAASVMLSPMEALRIRLVAEPEYARLGWIRGGFRMIEREGSAGFRKGLLPMIYKQVPYTISKNVSFDWFTKMGYRSLLLDATTASSTAKFAIPLASAALASMISCFSSQPGDMLLSLVNAHGGTRGTHDIARAIMQSDRGVQGFLVGIKTRLVHVGIIVTLQLLIYDFVKRLCGIAATGSV